MVWEQHASNAGFSSARPWLPVPAEHLPKAVDAAPVILNRYRAALAFRRAHIALRLGTIRILEAGGHILAFERTTPAESLLCIFNLSGTARTWREATIPPFGWLFV
jgi:alpha-glucosidase